MFFFRKLIFMEEVSETSLKFEPKILLCGVM
jgi:hypothetical protein